MRQMAEEATLSFVVEMLSNALINNASLLRGVEGKVNYLRDELEWIRSFLRDADYKKQYSNDERICKWISDIIEVAHDAKDAIETFILKVENPKKERGFLGIRCICFPKHMINHQDQIGEEIESIMTRLADIEKRRHMYGIQSHLIAIERRLRWSFPWEIEECIVGLEEDVELVLQRAILHYSRRLFVSTIVGVGGMGKTTLAKMVYNHPTITANFELRAWVCVSYEFNMNKVIKDIVWNLLDPNEDKLKVLEVMELMHEEQLYHLLYERLHGKQYLIVLDDVWEQQVWESLARIFPDEDTGSRVLITSRKSDIPKYARYIHDLKSLDQNNSWKLFLEKASIKKTYDQLPEDLKIIGNEILEKCDGLPLAITVVGGMLRGRFNTTSEWNDVLKGMKSLIS
ncbi:hypothetical protein ACJIZ3_007808 [Penstemon smallii]|uniref:Uncharacterized protein n=1 Tax=Penstemon smallii TaxID=265156 RepID=A0ABD3T7Z9_9LAMI